MPVPVPQYLRLRNECCDAGVGVLVRLVVVQRPAQADPDYKFKVALEAAKGTKTLAQLASELGVHPHQISQWKGQLLGGGAKLFDRSGETTERQVQQREAERYEQIGRLKMDLAWLKRKVAS